MNKDNIITVCTDEASALLVEGIEDWIATLLPVDESSDMMLRMVDPKTGAVFLIKRVK